MKIKNGFTLAEVLVALSIVGIIAAVAIPLLINNQPNKEMVMLKKAYYNTSRVVTELVNDQNLYPDGEDTENSGFSHIYISDTNNGQEAMYEGEYYFGPEKFCRLFAARFNSSGASCNSRITLAAGGNFRTPDGIVWSMPYGNFNAGAADGSDKIYVDVNGPEGNNCSIEESDANLTRCPNGVIPDQFSFRVSRFGKVTFPGLITKLYIAERRNTKRFFEYSDELKDTHNIGDTGSGDRPKTALSDKEHMTKDGLKKEFEMKPDEELNFWEDISSKKFDPDDDDYNYEGGNSINSNYDPPSAENNYHGYVDFMDPSAPNFVCGCDYGGAASSAPGYCFDGSVPGCSW